jgi:hypothetical protein
MHASPQHTARSQPEHSRIDAALAQTLHTHGCTPAQITHAAALWQGFVADVGAKGFSGSALPWYAALHYLVAPLVGDSLTQREVATRYQISPSTLAARVKQLAEYRQQLALPDGYPARDQPRPGCFGEHREPPPHRSPVMAILSAARKLTSATKVTTLDDDAWIRVFSHTHRLVSTLYRDRSHIEILLYLAHVEVNVLLGGYCIEPSAIADQFGKMFARLGLQAAKGRDARKFVYLHDIFGKQEPFALLKLESEHG